MKKLVLLLAGLMLLFPSPAGAATTADITITATGIVVAAPGGFTLTYVSDYEIGIDWVKAVGAENTMVRAAVGRYPETITDGYLVYYGDGTSATDTGVSLDETAAAVYYRAWSETAGGVFSPVWAEGLMEGIGVIIVGIAALILVAIIGLGLAWSQKNVIFAIIGTFVMLMAGFFSYTKIETDGDLFWGFFLGCMGMAFMGILEAVSLRPTSTEPDEIDEDAPKPPKRIKLTSSRVAEIRRRQEFNRIANRNQAIVNQQRRSQ